MKPLALALIFIVSTSLTPIAAHADFGEIDLLVQESIERFFAEHGQAVNVDQLQYLTSPAMVDSVMAMQTAVWAQEPGSGDWRWFQCRTEIHIEAPHRFSDLGSTCH